jgi:stage IV sporulation protein FB
MSWSFPIGRLLGSEVRIHATFFLLLLWVGASAWGIGGAGAALSNILFVMALFACVVAHEFGHALMARRFGIRTPDITLLPIGGLARLERMPDRPFQEIAVALAGPLVNVVIAAALWLAGFGPSTSLALETSAGAFASALLSVNILLVLFNMIPAFPMDGGRVLRGVLAIFLPRLRATLFAVRIGQAFALAFAAYALWSGNFLLGLVALFVFLAGNAELGQMKSRAALSDLSVGDAMLRDFTHLSPDAPVSAAAELVRSSDQSIFPVVGRDGKLAGFVEADAILEADGGGRIADVMEADVMSLPMSRPAGHLLDVLGERHAIGVTGPSGRLVGYVTQGSAARLLRRRAAR